MTKSAASDEVLSVSDLLAMVGTARAAGKSLHTVVNSVSQRVMDGVGQDPWEAVPMILVKHRWMKGRSVVAGNTVIAFEMDGIARVRSAGNALLDVQSYVQNSKGVAEILPTQDPKPVVPDLPQIQEKPQELPKVEEEEIQTSAREVAESEPVSEDAVQEPIKKKPPKIRRPS